jgi:hypothetical protein
VNGAHVVTGSRQKRHAASPDVFIQLELQVTVSGGT